MNLASTMRGDNTCKNKRLYKSLLLRGKGEFSEVWRKGKLLKGKYVNVYCMNCKESKVGFAVSRGFKKAVERNRMKRLLREVYRNEKAFFASKKVILFAKRSNGPPSYWQVRSDVVSILTDKEKINDCKISN